MTKKQGHYSCYLYDGKGILVSGHMMSLLYACTTLVLLIRSGNGRSKPAVCFINVLASSALIAVGGFSTEKMSYGRIWKPLLSPSDSLQEKGSCKFENTK